MFCKNCGIELEDTMAFCPECGTKVEVEAACEETAVPAVEEVVVEVEATVAEPVQEEASEADVVEGETTVEAEPFVENNEDTYAEDTSEEFAQQNVEEYSVAPQEYTEEPQEPAKKSNKLLVSIIAAVLMIALVVAGVFVVPKLFGGNYEDVAINYSLAYAQADMIEASKYTVNDFMEAYSKMVDYSCEEYEMTQEEFYELLSEQYGETITSVEQLFVIMKEDTVTYLQEEYGNYTLSANIKGAEVLTETEITELKDSIKEEQSYDYPSMFEGVDADKISEGYTVDVEVTINGTESNDMETQDVVVVKYNGKWKVISD